MKNMLLVSTSFGEKQSFKMMPLTQDCPYNECIFDPERKTLAIISKEKKETLHMIPRLTESGDPQMVPGNKGRSSGKPYAEQRINLDSYYEHYIQEEVEILDFIKMFSMNSDANILTFEMIVKDAFIVKEEKTLITAE